MTDGAGRSVVSADLRDAIDVVVTVLREERLSALRSYEAECVKGREHHYVAGELAGKVNALDVALKLIEDHTQPDDYS